MKQRNDIILKVEVAGTNLESVERDLDNHEVELFKVFGFRRSSRAIKVSEQPGRKTYVTAEATLREPFSDDEEL